MVVVVVVVVVVVCVCVWGGGVGGGGVGVGGCGVGGWGHCLYAGSYICENYSPPAFLMITSPPPLFPNFTTPIFFVMILYNLHYIIYRAHFLTTAFTAPIFRHPRNYRPPFLLILTAPAFWRWAAHNPTPYHHHHHHHQILSQMPNEKCSTHGK